MHANNTYNLKRKNLHALQLQLILIRNKTKDQPTCKPDRFSLAHSQEFKSKRKAGNMSQKSRENIKILVKKLMIYRGKKNKKFI